MSIDDYRSGDEDDEHAALERIVEGLSTLIPMEKEINKDEEANI